MPLRKVMPWAAAILSAALLELPFPLAGPMPPWRGLFAFVGLVPLLWAILTPSESPRPLRHAFLIGYLCGILWYAGNCYWIYDTMQIHGGIPPIGALGILLLYSLVLGLYFGLFTLALKFIAHRIGIGMALIAAPFLWTGLDLAGARITSVPWDQLGYSQVNNYFLTVFAPWTGVYGITFVLVAINAMYAGIRLGVFRLGKNRFAVQGLSLCMSLGALLLMNGYLGRPPETPGTATAVLVQPNLDVDVTSAWPGPLWDQNISQFRHFATQADRSYLVGIPETGSPTLVPECSQPCANPSLIAWPESPAPFFQDEDRFRNAMKQLALTAHSPLIIGGVGMEQTPEELHYFNSGMVFDQSGTPQGRYDKIHLVPYGEFIPYRNLFFFAKKLTHKVEDLSRGTDRKTFLLTGTDGQQHRYGIFICYESVFADEIRHFALNGAEVLVNISDDGWYGDTSAPWQHLNMARMRAIENRRWILRDTNNGVTSVIDPYGRVRQSIPRHTVGALVAQYGFNSETTFYTRHGDVFAWACAILSIGFVAWSFNTRLALKVQIKSGPEQIS
jgi:apolipoprotein N-acyltransferase